MDSHWKQHYSTLVEFLGNTLGPDYEIVLHSFVDNEYKIIALANEHISGRTTQAPLSSLALNFIFNKEYQDKNFIYGYEGISAAGDKLRCSTMFIKDDDGTLLGMLCINYRAEKYTKFAEGILQFVKENYELPSLEADQNNLVEEFSASPKDICEVCALKLFGSKQIPQNLNKEDRQKLFNELNSRGIFKLKGAIVEIAKQTGLAKSTIYRYIKE